MLTWEEFESFAPELARFGADRMAEHVMYIGTIRRDGSPRVHPFTPFVGSGHLFAFMEPTSPKGFDLRRDGRYAIHSLVKEMNGTGGEFAIYGKARPIDNPKVRSIAVKGCPYTPQERYVCFEFLIESCTTTHYVDGKPQYVLWKAPGSKS